MAKKQTEPMTLQDALDIILSAVTAAAELYPKNFIYTLEGNRLTIDIEPVEVSEGGTVNAVE
jgi:hypothetical protein